MTDLTIGGGNFKGFAFLGALEYLHSKNYITCINNFYGSSIGAIIGTLYLINYKPYEILNIFLNINLKHFWDFSIDNINNNYSILGDNFYNFYFNTFSKKEDTNITLLEFYNKYNIKLNILSVCLNDRSIIEFNIDNFPNLKVIDAVRASFSIPILFSPVKINNKFYVDACVKNNPGTLNKNKTGYIIKLDNYYFKVNNFFEYLYEVFLTSCTNEEIFNNINTININLPDEYVKTIRFDSITNTDKIKLFYIGIEQAKKQMNSF